MTITVTKKRTTETTKPTEAPVKKSPLGSTEPSTTKERPTNIAAVVRRPAAPPSVGGTTPKAEDAKPKKPTYEARMRALAPVVRLRRKLASTSSRFSNVNREVQRWSNAPAEIRDAATALTTALAAIIAVATALPDDFKPERARKAGSRQLAPGAKAVLRAKVAAKYDGILEPEERSTLEVVSVTRGHVSVKTASGARVVLPRGHVAKLTTEQAIEGTRGSIAPGERPQG